VTGTERGSITYACLDHVSLSVVKVIAIHSKSLLICNSNSYLIFLFLVKEYLPLVRFVGGLYVYLARLLITFYIDNTPCSVLCSPLPEARVSRAGLSKCGARLEALLRGPIQWRVQKVLSGASSHIDRNR